MAHETTNKSKTEPTSVEPPRNLEDKNQTASLNSSQIVAICATGLLVSFFLPWIQFFGNQSGFDFAKGNKRFYFFWTLPICCAITIVAGVAKRGQTGMATLTGVIPFCILGWGLMRFGENLLKTLAIGAYAGLALGFVMLMVARRIK